MAASSIIRVICQTRSGSSDGIPMYTNQVKWTTHPLNHTARIKGSVRAQNFLNTNLAKATGRGICRLARARTSEARTAVTSERGMSRSGSGYPVPCREATMRPRGIGRCNSLRPSWPGVHQEALERCSSCLITYNGVR